MVSESHPAADPETAAIAERILDYLRRHPRAADTWEGIAAWWIEAGPGVRPETVRAALEYLAAAGLVMARRLPTAEWLYSAAPGRPTQGPDAPGEINKSATRQTESDEDGDSGRE